MPPRRGWHRCERWFRRGYPCPYRQLGTRDDEETDEEQRRRAAEQALPIPIVGEKKREIRSTKIVNIEDYINEVPPVEVPIPHKVAATRPTPPSGGPGDVPLFRPQPGRGGTPGAGDPLPQEAWQGLGAKELARGIIAGSSAPRDVLAVGAAHSLWRAPPTMPKPVQAKIIRAPRLGEAPIPLYENELASASQSARAGQPAHVPAPVLGVRDRPQTVQHSFGTPPAEIAAETKGVIAKTKRTTARSATNDGGNTWGTAAVIGSAMAAVAIYALAKGGIGMASAVEQAVTQRIPDNRATGTRPGGAGGRRGTVRPGAQVFNFWDMLNGIGFQ